jgi:hypothetical protein
LTTGQSKHLEISSMGMLFLSLSTNRRRRSSSQGTIEEKGAIDMIADKPVDILVEYTNSSPPNGSTGDKSSQPALMRGVVRFFNSRRFFS